MYSDGRSSIITRQPILGIMQMMRVKFVCSLQSSAAFHSETWTCHVYVADWVPADMSMAFN